jgi:UDPglucose 6-dehydrogenase
MKIAVIGTGYVGLVSGACFAAWGHDVTCVDIDSGRIEKLKYGHIPIFEPGLADCVRANLHLGRLRFTTDLRTALHNVDIAFIAVGTPASDHDGEADLSCVFEAGRQIAALLDVPAVIVTKSTVPIGTSERLEALMRSVRPDGQFIMASNPEFLREGSAIEDFNRPDRVVLGCDDESAEAILRALYLPLSAAGVPVVVTSRRSAELIKYAANSFLATKITFINEMADLCERVGADIDEIAIGMGLDSRIGKAFLKAGPGYGGSCFPKDTIALLRTAQEHGVSLRLVEQTISANSSRKRTLANRLKTLLGGTLAGRHIAVLGLTFKAETDDMRDAPSQTLIHALQCAGATISAYDPAGMENASRQFCGVEFASSPIECARNADAVVVMTDWKCFKDIDLRRLRTVVRQRFILDLRGIYDVDELVEKHGFTVDRVGRAVRYAETPQRIRLNGEAANIKARSKVHNGLRHPVLSLVTNNHASTPREEFFNEHNEIL